MKENIKKLVNQFKITLFHIAPLHLISNITFRLSRIEDFIIKNFLIKTYTSIFKIKLDEYKIKNIDEYSSLNGFFTRELDLSFRKPLIHDDNIISPCDGTIAGFGEISNDTFIHAKKHRYSTKELIHENIDTFHNGKFINIYLEPKDCHRIYMPCDAILTKVTHVPGSLYSVAPYATIGIRKLYSRNERVILSFQNSKFIMSMIMIGAVNVGCISLSDKGIIAPAKHRDSIIEFENKNKKYKYKKGQEIGMFNLGSTVIMLINNIDADWQDNIITNNKILIRDEVLKLS